MSSFQVRTTSVISKANRPYIKCAHCLRNGAERFVGFVVGSGLIGVIVNWGIVIVGGGIVQGVLDFGPRMRQWLPLRNSGVFIMSIAPLLDLSVCRKTVVGAFPSHRFI